MRQARLVNLSRTFCLVLGASASIILFVYALTHFLLVFTSLENPFIAYLEAAYDSGLWYAVARFLWFTVLVWLFIGAWQAWRLDWFECGWRYRYGFGWTVGTLFVPILDFVRPWMGLAEIDARLRVAAKEDVADMENEDRTSPLSVGLAIAMFLLLLAPILYEREFAGERLFLYAVLEFVAVAAFVALAVAWLGGVRHNLDAFARRIEADREAVAAAGQPSVLNR
ncbi:MAG: hypothetical protein AB7O63_17110 [Reyranellaceae bacterium]